MATTAMSRVPSQFQRNPSSTTCAIDPDSGSISLPSTSSLNSQISSHGSKPRVPHTIEQESADDYSKIAHSRAWSNLVGEEETFDQQPVMAD